MLRRLFQPRPGTRYEGHACYTDDYQLVPRPGYYALTDDGKQLRKPLLRLVCVDDAPGDPDGIACHYEVAAKNDPIQKRNANVRVKATLHGESGVAA